MLVKRQTIKSVSQWAALTYCLFSVTVYSAFIAPLCTMSSPPGTNNQIKMYPVVMPRACKLGHYFDLPEKLNARRASIRSISNVAHFVYLVQTCYAVKVECAPIYFSAMPSDISEIFQISIEDATLVDVLDDFIRICWCTGWPVARLGVPPSFPVAVITPSNVIITTAAAVPEFRGPIGEFDLFKEDDGPDVTLTNKPAAILRQAPRSP